MAKWYDTQAHADAAGTAGLAGEFKSDGTLEVEGGQGLTFSTSGGTITVSMGGQTAGTMTYVITGTKLTISGQNNIIPPGDYFKKQ